MHPPAKQPGTARLTACLPIHSKSRRTSNREALALDPSRLTCDLSPPIWIPVPSQTRRQKHATTLTGAVRTQKRERRLVTCKLARDCHAQPVSALKRLTCFFRLSPLRRSFKSQSHPPRPPSSAKCTTGPDFPPSHSPLGGDLAG